VDYTYVLWLRDGQIAAAETWPSISQNLDEGHSPEKAADNAKKLLAATEEARKAAIIARDLKIILNLNV
jgi:hypothetical protein